MGLLLLTITLQMIGLVLVGELVSLLMVRKRSSHAAWPVVLAAVYGLGQTYGFPLALPSMGFAIPWIVMAWFVVVAILMAIVVGFNYAWNCSVRGEVPNFRDYKHLAVGYTAKIISLQRSRLRRAQGR